MLSKCYLIDNCHWLGLGFWEAPCYGGFQESAGPTFLRERSEMAQASTAMSCVQARNTSTMQMPVSSRRRPRSTIAVCEPSESQSSITNESASRHAPSRNCTGTSLRTGAHAHVRLEFACGCGSALWGSERMCKSMNSHSTQSYTWSL